MFFCFGQCWSILVFYYIERGVLGFLFLSYVCVYGGYFWVIVGGSLGVRGFLWVLRYNFQRQVVLGRVVVRLELGNLSRLRRRSVSQFVKDVYYFFFQESNFCFQEQFYLKVGGEGSGFIGGRVIQEVWIFWSWGQGWG